MNKLDFSHLLTIYRACKFDMDGKSATLTVSDKIFQALQIAFDLDNLDDSGLSCACDPDKIKVGATIRLFVSDPKIGLGYLAKNFNALISMRRAAFIEPRNYFLIEEKFYRDDPNPPSSILRYRKVLELIKILEKCSAYLDKDREELVFINGGKYAVPIKYTAGELANVDVPAIEKLLKNFEVKDDSHIEQKIAILTETLLALMNGASPGWRFKNLLIESVELQDKFADGYKLYLANFSYEKVRNDLQAWKVDYTGKLHKAFADIQNQLLSMPVATVIVATQLKQVAKEGGANFLNNVAVLIGCWIFSALFLLLCFNQFTTLKVFESEIERQRKKMAEEYEVVLAMKDFKEVFDSLKMRVNTQQCILKVVLGVLVIGIVLAHVFFWLLSKEYFQS